MLLNIYKVRVYVQDTQIDCLMLSKICDILDTGYVSPYTNCLLYTACVSSFSDSYVGRNVIQSVKSALIS